MPRSRRCEDEESARRMLQDGLQALNHFEDNLQRSRQGYGAVVQQLAISRKRQREAMGSDDEDDTDESCDTDDESYNSLRLRILTERTKVSLIQTPAELGMDPGPAYHELHNACVMVLRGVFGREKNQRVPYSTTNALRETNWLEKSLSFEHRRFRHIYRVSHNTFSRLVEYLGQSDIFVSRSNRPQREITYQLCVFLMRYGVPGANALQPAVQTGFGEGTVFVYCERVIRAIRECSNDFVGWPDAERKAVIKREFRRRCGMDGVIGCVDGTLLTLMSKPLESGIEYLSRKQSVAINVQAIVDHQCRFTNFEMGWPGSKHDGFIWKRCRVWKIRNRLFAPGEFLLGDGGYPITPFLLRPFTRVEAGGEHAQCRRHFNRKLSSARVLIECAFGQLKHRFPSLLLLSVPHDIEDLYRVVQALMILHNMCIDFHDTANGLPDEFIRQAVLRAEQEEIEEGNYLIDRVGNTAEDDELDQWNGIEGVDGPALLAAGKTMRDRFVEQLAHA